MDMSLIDCNFTPLPDTNKNTVSKMANIIIHSPVKGEALSLPVLQKLAFEKMKYFKSGVLYANTGPTNNKRQESCKEGGKNPDF